MKEHTKNIEERTPRKEQFSEEELKAFPKNVKNIDSKAENCKVEITLDESLDHYRKLYESEIEHYLQISKSEFLRMGNDENYTIEPTTYSKFMKWIEYNPTTLEDIFKFYSSTAKLPFFPLIKFLSFSNSFPFLFFLSLIFFLIQLTNEFTLKPIKKNFKIIPTVKIPIPIAINLTKTL